MRKIIVLLLGMIMGLGLTGCSTGKDVEVIHQSSETHKGESISEESSKNQEEDTTKHEKEESKQEEEDIKEDPKESDGCDSNIFDYTHSISDDTYIINGFSEEFKSENNPTSLCIPGTHKGRPIFEIAVGAFRDLGLTKVDFSEAENLEYISSDSFNNNNLKEIDLTKLSSLLYISEGAFEYNYLTEVDFSNNPRLEVVHPEAFSFNGPEQNSFLLYWTPDIDSTDKFTLYGGEITLWEEYE